MSSQVRPDVASATSQLHDAVDTLHRFIRTLPPAALVEKVWGAKEVLAHLVFWIESYILQLEAIQAGSVPLPPQGRFDDLNLQVVAASRGVAVDELLRRHQRASERLCRFAQTLDPEQTMLALTKGAVLHPLIWFVTAEAGHIRDHHRMLVQQTQRNPLSDVARLRATIEGFCRFVHGLPHASLAEQASRSKKALAHLVVCHEILVAQIAAILAHQPFRLPEGADLTAQIAEASRQGSVEELVGRFEAAGERLHHFSQTLDPQNINLEVWRLEMKRGSTRRTLDEVVVWLEAQIRSQQRKLARYETGMTERLPGAAG